MNNSVSVLEFRSWNFEEINKQYINIIPNGDIASIEEFRQQIERILKYNEDEYPQWFINTIEYAITAFLDMLKIRTNQPQQIKESFYKLRNGLIYNKYEGGNQTNNFYTLPFLEDYARSLSLEKQMSQLDIVKIEIDNSISQFKTDSGTSLEASKNEFKDFKIEADKTLELLHKEAGKIGVKKYAEIFEAQAFEHSHIFKKNSNVESKWKITGIGKAQYWLIFALIFLGCLLFAFTQLDNLFKLYGALTYTPEITVHILGRIVFISLFIFLISFSFKQYRVNMHLYTLNKHRANTLKSFEYLTRAPDTLDPSSYNAILMEVAKAIYEAGQTGYISSNENSGDLPSIIDMTKVFNTPKP